MRRFILLLSAAVLAALVAARAALPDPAAAAMAAPAGWDSGAYNVLDWDLSSQPETAGSSYIGALDAYFLSCPPTAKHPYTGLLAGQNLILLLAEDWHLSGPDPAGAPAAYRLWQEGVRFEQVFAPDWYQGREGREFALLTGLTPTTVQNCTAMDLLGRQDILLPFALGRCLADAGYICRAYPASAGQEAAYAALGFETRTGAALEEELAELGAAGPFFAYRVLDGADPDAALDRLEQALDRAGLRDDTAVCLLTAGGQPLTGGLFLRGQGLAGLTVTAPCSELDVTPTLLDLFGAAYDARFLSGRDLLADGAAAGPPALVSLYGSAYGDWVTDAGRYRAAEDVFLPAEGHGTDERYVRRMRQLVYDRYTVSRRILESNYFRLAAGR